MKRPDDGLLKLIQEKSKPVYQPHHSYSTSFTGKTQTTELFEQIITGLGETGEEITLWQFSWVACFGGTLIPRLPIIWH